MRQYQNSKAHDHKSYENDQEKVDKIDAINSLQSNNDNLKAKLTQITSVADKNWFVDEWNSIDNEKIVNIDW